MTNAAVLWTGGKDSALALHKAIAQGYHIQCLVTFAPKDPQFLAHSLELMKLQAASLGLPHYLRTIEAPFDKSYEDNLTWLRDEFNIDCVITGDIALVHGSSNWIRDRCQPIGLDVFTPLWDGEREALLLDLIAGGFEVLFTCVHSRWLTSDWVGRTLDQGAIDALKTLRNGIDLCGEQGEYHTMVINGPHFQQRINLERFSIKTSDVFHYMAVEQLS
uniref:Dph6-related ATP pyrophosphatase n=1 Tax=Thaumasiovibrio occultus TaxID=1891184 RepID=UPI00131D36D6|nr:diphthine--ammonia ligase [Thaumasiovibrio occultus]